MPAKTCVIFSNIFFKEKLINYHLPTLFITVTLHFRRSLIFQVFRNSNNQCTEQILVRQMVPGISMTQTFRQDTNHL